MERGTERLSSTLEHLFHSSEVDNPECHLSAADLDEPDVLTIIQVLQGNQVVDVIVLGGFEVGFDVHLVGVFELHGGVGVETFS